MWGWRYLKSGEEVGGFVVGGEAEVGRGGVAVGAKGTLERQLVLHVLNIGQVPIDISALLEPLGQQLLQRDEHARQVAVLLAFQPRTHVLRALEFQVGQFAALGHVLISQGVGLAEAFPEAVRLFVDDGGPFLFWFLGVAGWGMGYRTLKAGLTSGAYLLLMSSLGGKREQMGSKISSSLSSL